MSGVGGLIIGIAALLGLVAFLPGIGQRLRLPFTVLLAGLGCVVGVAVGLLGSFEHTVPAGPLRDPAHPRPLVGGHPGVVGRELEHPVAGPGQGIGDAEQLVGIGVGAGDQFAGLRPVDRRARRREQPQDPARLAVGPPHDTDGATVAG